MTRDTFDRFTAPERGRFGDNETIRGNDSVRSDLVDLTLTLRKDKPLAIAVTDPAKPGAAWIWLPKSKIEYQMTSPTVAIVSMPQWLALEKGLV